MEVNRQMLATLCRVLIRVSYVNETGGITNAGALQLTVPKFIKELGRVSNFN